MDREYLVIKIGIEKMDGAKVKFVTVRHGADTLKAGVAQQGAELSIVLEKPVTLSTGESLFITA